MIVSRLWRPRSIKSLSVIIWILLTVNSGKKVISPMINNLATSELHTVNNGEKNDKTIIEKKKKITITSQTRALIIWLNDSPSWQLSISNDSF